ncbi:MAG TPA: cupredoxin domain-containing protein [Acidimicrobiales bacterium]
MPAARSILALLCAVGLAAGCGAADPSTPTAEDLREIDLSVDHTITVDERGFSPAELEIASGDVVLLVNDGDSAHSFTADERFDTGRMLPGEETTLILTEPGEIPYRDLENPDTEGTLTVIAAQDL